MPASNLDEREIFWISYYREKFPKGMTNISAGGSGVILKGEDHPNWGKKCPKKTRQRIGEANRGEANGMYGTNLREVWEQKYGPEIANQKLEERNQNIRESLVNSEKFQKSRKSKEYREKISRVAGMQVYVLDSDLNIVGEFHSCPKAAEWLGCKRANVQHARRDKRKLARKYWVVSQEDYHNNTNLPFDLEE